MVGPPWRISDLMNRHAFATSGLSARILGLGAVLGLLASALPAQARADEGAGVEFFEQKIRPVLVEHCYRCHSSESKSLKGKLRLDSRGGGPPGGRQRAGDRAWRRGGEPAHRGTPLRADGDAPSGKLPDEVIADFERWVEIGAPDPREEPSGAPRRRPRRSTSTRPGSSGRSGRRPATSPRRSTTRAGSAGPIDSFVLARLAAVGLAASPPADRRTLIRRVTLRPDRTAAHARGDRAFVSRRRPAAYERLVDSLLASPPYGEHGPGGGWTWPDMPRTRPTSSATIRR